MKAISDLSPFPLCDELIKGELVIKQFKQWSIMANLGFIVRLGNRAMPVAGPGVGDEDGSFSDADWKSWLASK